MQNDPLTILRMNRKAALDLAAHTGKKSLEALLKSAAADLVERLAHVKAFGAGSGSFTAVQLELALKQIRDVTRSLKVAMKGLVLSQASTAADKSIGNLVAYMGAANKEFAGITEAPLPLKEIAMLSQAQTGARASALRRLATSGEEDAAPENVEEHRGKLGILDRYGVETVGVFEETLQKGLLTKKPWAEMRDEITSASPFLQQAPRFWAERIVRTETIGAYNRAGWEGIRTANEMLGDMVKILSATFDDRTGWDSYALHGQIRRSDEPFEWWEGKFQHPPNRPNDREIVVPHRIAWPLPKYLTWKSDAEVLKRYLMQRKKGRPPPRPRMTTIPLSKFGHDDD